MDAAQSDKLLETKIRVKTAVVGATLFLGLLIGGGQIGATILTVVLGVAMCWELSRVFYKLSDRSEKTVALLGTAWILISSNAFLTRSLFEGMVVSFIGLFIYFLATAERHADQLQKHFLEFIFTMFALFYIVAPLSYLPLIRGSAQGIAWTMLFLCMVWSCDTGAYFAGRKWGKNKLYPLISPGKSWEGAIAGIASAVLVAVIFRLLFLRNLSWVGVFIIPIVISTLSQIGDLCESFFKRSYQIKDTSALLPGHGGVLDRFDAVVFTLPGMYYVMKLFS